MVVCMPSQPYLLSADSCLLAKTIMSKTEAWDQGRKAMSTDSDRKSAARTSEQCPQTASWSSGLVSAARVRTAS